ncbi:MAG: hypothetical protein ACOY0T_23545 [Myxococcota bacterium]
MAESRGPLRNAFTILLLSGTVLGLYNVYSDNADVRALGEKTACSNRPCKATVTRESRSPIAQTFTYQVELSEKGKTSRGASVDVECQRAYFLVGEYRCTARGTLP